MNTAEFIGLFFLGSALIIGAISLVDGCNQKLNKSGDVVKAERPALCRKMCLQWGTTKFNVDPINLTCTCRFE